MEATGPRDAEVRRILDRYLVEVVEGFGLCPWAQRARTSGELAVAIVWGEPDARAFADAATRVFTTAPETKVAMVVAPECALDRLALGRVRDEVAAVLGSYGVAEFHPEADLDLSTPARLVPFVRRSPDPMLQLVPMRVLDAVRAPPPVADRARQLEILRGAEATPSVTASIAATNHATVTERVLELEAILDDIAVDRAGSY